MESVLLVSALLLLTFGSRPLFEMLRKKRDGEELIGNPWEEIHAIKGYKESRKVAAFYPLWRLPLHRRDLYRGMCLPDASGPL